MNDASLINIDPDNPVNAHDFLMSKTLTEKLQQHYPNYLWGVHVDHRTGLIAVKNYHLTGNHGSLLKLSGIYSASSLEKEVIREGGEMLERFNMSRRAFDEDEYFTAPVDFAGRLLFDKS